MVSLTPESDMASATPTLDTDPSQKIGSRSATLFWRIRHNPQMIIGIICISIFLIPALFAPWITRRGPAELDLGTTFAEPSTANYFGTDEMGRDLFSRIVYGGRVSLQVAGIAVGIGLGVGLSTGLVAGYFGGWVDNIIMRVMDALQAFPAILLAIVIAAVLGPGLTNTMIAIGIVSIPRFSRIMRGQVLQLKEEEFIEASRALGAGDVRLIIFHILPNGLAPIIVAAAVSSAAAILTEASLSFVGLGAKPPTPSWGGMLQTGYKFLEIAPWLSIYPGLAIAITTLGLNFLGDGLRDVLDPKLKGR